jgi:hypothetical protein
MGPSLDSIRVPRDALSERIVWYTSSEEETSDRLLRCVLQMAGFVNKVVGIWFPGSMCQPLQHGSVPMQMKTCESVEAEFYFSTSAASHVISLALLVRQP